MQSLPPLSPGGSAAPPSDEVRAPLAFTVESKAVPAPAPVTMGEYRAVAALLLLFVANVLLAILFAKPALDAGLQAFEDPEDPGNSIVYILIILAFTAIILYIARKGIKWLIRGIILAAVAATIVYVTYPVLWQTVGLSFDLSLGIGLAVAAAATAALYWHPEWYVLDAVGLVVAAGSAAIFGISLGIVPTILLLAGLAIYDFIAVYKTKHMLSLADTVIDLRLPVLLVIPKHGKYRFLAESSKFKEASAETKGEREAMFMGLGDLVMPAILVVSALQFAQPGWGAIPSVGAAVGMLVGYAVLMGFVLKGNPQAGLPLLNGGAIVGFVAGVYHTTGSLRFW